VKFKYKGRERRHEAVKFKYKGLNMQFPKLIIQHKTMMHANSSLPQEWCEVEARAGEKGNKVVGKQ